MGLPERVTGGGQEKETKKGTSKQGQRITEELSSGLGTVLCPPSGHRAGRGSRLPGQQLPHHQPRWPHMSLFHSALRHLVPLPSPRPHAHPNSSGKTQALGRPRLPARHLPYCLQTGLSGRRQATRGPTLLLLGLHSSPASHSSFSAIKKTHNRGP